MSLSLVKNQSQIIYWKQGPYNPLSRRLKRINLTLIDTIIPSILKEHHWNSKASVFFIQSYHPFPESIIEKEVLLFLSPLHRLIWQIIPFAAITSSILHKASREKIKSHSFPYHYIAYPSRSITGKVATLDHNPTQTILRFYTFCTRLG